MESFASISHMYSLKLSIYAALKDLFANTSYQPLLLTKWASVALFNPQAHAALMKTVVTFTPNHNTIFRSRRKP